MSIYANFMPLSGTVKSPQRAGAPKCFDVSASRYTINALHYHDYLIIPAKMPQRRARLPLPGTNIWATRFLIASHFAAMQYIRF
jgi:hypothetical protein